MNKLLSPYFPPPLFTFLIGKVVAGNNNKNHPRDPTPQPNFRLHRQWDKPLREEKTFMAGILPAIYLLPSSVASRYTVRK